MWDNSVLDFVYNEMVIVMREQNKHEEFDNIFNLLKKSGGVGEFYFKFSKFLEDSDNLWLFRNALFHYDFLYGDGLERFYEWAITNFTSLKSVSGLLRETLINIKNVNIKNNKHENSLNFYSELSLKTFYIANNYCNVGYFYNISSFITETYGDKWNES